MRKDVAGYDLKSLLIGSEGTLGIVTAAWLRLIPAPEAALPVVALYPDTAAGCAAIEAVLGSGAPAGGARVPRRRRARAAGGPAPFDGAGRGAVHGDRRGRRLGGARRRRLRGELREVLGEDALARPGAGRAPPSRGAVALARRRRDRRDRAARRQDVARTSSCRSTGSPRRSTRPLEIGARHGLEACSWGHAGDGNLHSTFLVDRAGSGRAGARRARPPQELFATRRRAGRLDLRRARPRAGQARPPRPPVERGDAAAAPRRQARDRPAEPDEPRQEGLTRRQAALRRGPTLSLMLPKEERHR